MLPAACPSLSGAADRCPSKDSATNSPRKNFASLVSARNVRILYSGNKLASARVACYTVSMVTTKELAARVGGLSNPSKMPGFAYGIPAQDCILGAILRQKKGSTCEKCYALKGMYSFPVVKNAQRRRMESISQPGWVADMTELLARKYKKRKKADRVFRWHDSGDLQSLEHLSKIVQIANNLPDIRFWLPTREQAMVREYFSQGNKFPRNLVVRVSAAMRGQKIVPPAGTVASTVGANVGNACPAYRQGGKCLTCRACWDNSVESVDYPLH